MPKNLMIEKLKALYELDGWDIVLVREEGSDGTCAEVDAQPNFKEACITLYVDEIERRRKNRFPLECEYRCINHELCEVVVSEVFNYLPAEMTETEAFMEFRDRMADRIRRIVARALANESDN